MWTPRAIHIHLLSCFVVTSSHGSLYESVYIFSILGTDSRHNLCIVTGGRATWYAFPGRAWERAN